MNTYPSFYPNMGQQQQMSSVYNNMYQQPIQQNYPQQIQPPPPAPVPTLTGKFVENKDIVGVTEIPVGSYGIFPTVNLKEIYVKLYNKNGSTDIVTYLPTNLPADPNEQQMGNMNNAVVDQILQKMSILEEKIDALTNNNIPIIDKKVDNEPQPIAGGF